MYSSFHEMKSLINEGSAIDVVDTGTITLLDGIALGPGVYQRIGRQVRLKHLNLRLFVTQQNGALNTQLCRYMIVYDKQCNGALPSMGSLLDQTGTAPNVARSLNRDYLSRFTVLVDDVLQVNPVSMPNSLPHVEISKKIDLPVQYNVTDTSSVGAIINGSLFLILFDQVPVGLINLKATFSAQVVFEDF